MSALPDPAVVVLVGPSGAGKSTWAAQRYRAVEIASSDALRAVVGTGPQDLDASTDAFAILDAVLAARCRRGLTTVVDTLGLEPGRRRSYLDLARSAGLPAVCVLFDTDPALCRERNAARAVPVPAPALAGQLARVRWVQDEAAAEGWDLVVPAGDHRPEPAHMAGAWAAAARAPAPLSFVLQISRFPWGTDPAGWLGSVVRAADEAGFTGVALMDHLIQIPQVGRAWDPIPEPWVTLGLIAGMSDRLRLGTLVSPVTFRAPGVLAKAVATLDTLSGGRVFCGLGAGWWAREHAAFGLDFPAAGARLDLLEQTIETMRALWSSGTKAYAGQRVQLAETTCYPRPVSAVPIIVGGSGPRTLRVAARLGDGANVRLSDLDVALPVLQRELDDAGRDVELSVLDVPVVGTDREQVAGIVERLRGRTPATTFASRHHAGTVTEQIGRYRLLADRGVHQVFLALPDLTGPAEVERMAPVVRAFLP